jgi:hypothetical protein
MKLESNYLTGSPHVVLPTSSSFLAPVRADTARESLTRLLAFVFRQTYRS